MLCHSARASSFPLSVSVDILNLLTKRENAHTYTQADQCRGANMVKLTLFLSWPENVLFDRWMWEAVTETKHS